MKKINTMEITDAMDLIRHPSLTQTSSSSWADLGSGSGLFTYALAALLPTGSVIYAIDKDQVVMNKKPNPKNVTIQQQQRDFITQELHLPKLDGILMANSLHYVEDKAALIHKLSKNLTDKGSFLIVEYNTAIANRWVPYPISYSTLKETFQQAGYTVVNKLQERPSLYGRANLYAAYIST